MKMRSPSCGKSLRFSAIQKVVRKIILGIVGVRLSWIVSGLDVVVVVVAAVAVVVLVPLLSEQFLSHFSTHSNS